MITVLEPADFAKDFGFDLACAIIDGEIEWDCGGASALSATLETTRWTKLIFGAGFRRL